MNTVITDNVVTLHSSPPVTHLSGGTDFDGVVVVVARVRRVLASGLLHRDVVAGETTSRRDCACNGTTHE